MSDINHEAAEVYASSSIEAHKQGSILSYVEIVVSRAYIDLTAQANKMQTEIMMLQRAEEGLKERVSELEAALGDGIEILEDSEPHDFYDDIARLNAIKDGNAHHAQGDEG